MCLEDVKLGRREYWRLGYTGQPALDTILLTPNPNRVGIVVMIGSSSFSLGGSITGNIDPVTGDVNEVTLLTYSLGFAIKPDNPALTAGIGVQFGVDVYSPPMRIEQYGMMIAGGWKCANNQLGVYITVLEIILNEATAQNI